MWIVFAVLFILSLVYFAPIQYSMMFVAQKKGAISYCNRSKKWVIWYGTARAGSKVDVIKIEKTNRYKLFLELVRHKEPGK